jgi:lysyl-tRNA synthetase class 2
VLRERIVAGRRGAPKRTGPGELQFGLFEAAVEHKLWQPTFIIDYPVEVSPAGACVDADPGDHRALRALHRRARGGNGFSAS